MEGDGPAPPEFWVGRICQEFGCLPSVAFREWERSPAGWLESVIDARHFADAWRIVKDAKKASDVPSTPLTNLAMVIQRELSEAELKREIERRKKANG